MVYPTHNWSHLSRSFKKYACNQKGDLISVVLQPFMSQMREDVTYVASSVIGGDVLIHLIFINAVVRDNMNIIMIMLFEVDL